MSYTPMGMPAPTPQPEYIRPSRDEPKIVYALMVLPLLQLVQFPFGSLTLAPTLALAAVIAVLGVPAAFADQRALHLNGHQRRTAPWLAVLPIVYLATRGSRRFDETGRGMAPFWVGLAIVLAVVFLLFWGPEGVLALLI